MIVFFLNHKWDSQLDEKRFRERGNIFPYSLRELEIGRMTLL